ncbi:hypothetical protein B0H14DRAFT_2639629 [Mycena olivaceomarginata]|nr:hypothetical protein B0H14DRAFT_2639629 [Mycena olivaceomarginata]
MDVSAISFRSVLDEPKWYAECMNEWNKAYLARARRTRSPSFGAAQSWTIPDADSEVQTFIPSTSRPGCKNCHRLGTRKNKEPHLTADYETQRWRRRGSPIVLYGKYEAKAVGNQLASREPALELSPRKFYAPGPPAGVRAGQVAAGQPGYLGYELLQGVVDFRLQLAYIPFSERIRRKMAEAMTKDVLRSTISTKISSLRQEIQSLSDDFNSLAGISAVHDDILLQIISLVAEDDCTPPKMLARMMQTRKQWHALVLASPLLWGRIDITCQSGLREIQEKRLLGQLRLSGSLALTLSMKSLDSPSFAALIFAHSIRIKSLDLSGSPDWVIDFMHRMRKFRFPQLEILSLDPSSYPHDDKHISRLDYRLPPKLLDGRMPRLRPSLAVLKLDQMLCTHGIGSQYARLPQLERLYLRDHLCICIPLLDRLAFPTTTGVTLYPFGVETGAQMNSLLAPIRNHLCAPNPAAAIAMEIEHDMQSHLRVETNPLGERGWFGERLIFSVNSYPRSAAQIRQVLVAAVVALPANIVTELNVFQVEFSTGTWKALLALLPAVESLHIGCDNGAIGLCSALCEAPTLRALRTIDIFMCVPQDEEETTATLIRGLDRVARMYHSDVDNSPLLRLRLEVHDSSDDLVDQDDRWYPEDHVRHKAQWAVLKGVLKEFVSTSKMVQQGLELAALAVTLLIHIIEKFRLGSVINRVFFWIVIYILTVILIGFDVPYNFPNLSTKTSPFTLVFAQGGSKAGGSFMNVVILTSVISAGNHALFAGARVVYGLPAIETGVPWVAVLAVASVSLIFFGASFLPGGVSNQITTFRGRLDSLSQGSASFHVGSGSPWLAGYTDVMQISIDQSIRQRISLSSSKPQPAYDKVSARIYRLSKPNLAAATKQQYYESFSAANQIAWWCIGVSSWQFRRAWVAQGRKIEELKFPNPSEASPLLPLSSPHPLSSPVGYLSIQGWSAWKGGFDKLSFVSNYRRHVEGPEDAKNNEDINRRERGKYGWLWKIYVKKAFSPPAQLGSVYGGLINLARNLFGLNIPWSILSSHSSPTGYSAARVFKLSEIPGLILFYDPADCVLVPFKVRFECKVESVLRLDIMSGDAVCIGIKP